MATTDENPLLQPWTAPHGLPPFARLAPGHFEPALEQAMREHREQLAAIAAQAEPPSFDNTLAAFDRAGASLHRVMPVFMTLTASATSPELQAVQRRMAKPLAAHWSAVFTDPALFARVHALHEARADLGLGPEALRLLERVHLQFERSGALLPAAQRDELAQVMQGLAECTTRFVQNVLHDESSWHLPLAEADLAPLPAPLAAALRQAAADRGLAGAVVTLSRSLIVPFLTHSPDATLRERAWRAWVSRGEHPGEHDNRELVRDILRLRQRQARLLGRACYADHALADTMAGSRAAVQGLLQQVWPRALQAVAGERALIDAARQAHGAAGGEIEPWDWRYWAEHVRREHFALDDSEVKAYFPLERVVEAAFDCAGRLFGLRFTARDDLPVYHPDVRAYEVSDAAGRVRGLFLQDNFARPNKRSGAWMNAMRWQHRNAGRGDGAVTPIILNNNNFAKGAPGQPTLLSLDDARTLFHEFGHGLHGLLSDVTYHELSGTKVLRDFVELPSQIFEHWITEPEVLRRHARHWQTGEPIPEALIERLHRARQFNQGYETVRYCASAIVDQAVHARGDEGPPEDVCAFEEAVLREHGLPHGVGLNHRLVHFQHLFGGPAYAAGYYVYLWAEVLDADGYDAFAEAGSPFDAGVAERLRRHVYAAGNTVEPGATYRAFRGRDAQVEPLLRKRGLVPAEAEPA